MISKICKNEEKVVYLPSEEEDTEKVSREIYYYGNNYRDTDLNQ